MKPSFYNIIIENTKQHETIIYNSLYGSMTIFDNLEYILVKEIMDKPNDVIGNDKKIIKSLLAQKYLVDDDLDEKAIIENRKKKGMKDHNRLDLIIMPTLDCNFNCIYCYEEKEKGKMSDETVNSLLKWMNIEIPKFKLVWLSWFGGEPLMAFDIIEKLTPLANQIASEHGVEIINHITTNGYLLTREKILKMIELKIYNYQITIDGIAETHNKLRPLKDGRGSFERVFKNIIELVSIDSQIKVTLRINFNHTNLYSVPELLSMFDEKYRSQLRLTLEPIFGSCEYNATDNLITQDIASTVSSYLKMAAEMGYDITIGKSAVETGKLVYCYAERENQYIINYTGDCFKCSVYNFTQSNRVGFFNNDGFVKEKEKWNAWMDFPLFDDVCRSCKYLPLCMGGCRKTRIQNRNNGSACSLIPSNAAYVLKQVAYNEFQNFVIKDVL